MYYDVQYLDKSTTDPPKQTKLKACSLNTAVYCNQWSN